MASLKKLWSVLSTLIVIAVVALAILLAGVRIVGLTPYVVLSGSMEPTYHTGSLIYDKKVDPFTLKEGDVITFMVSEDTLATHRIVGVVPDEDEPGTIRFRTKGDANDAEDGTLVHYKNVVGTPVFHHPLSRLLLQLDHPRPRQVHRHHRRRGVPDPPLPAGHAEKGRRGRQESRRKEAVRRTRSPRRPCGPPRNDRF